MALERNWLRCSSNGFFDTVLTRAQCDPCLRRSLFVAVSRHGNSGEILWPGARPLTAAGLLRDSVRWLRGRARVKRSAEDSDRLPELA
jgi:hypothetical protein